MMTTRSQMRRMTPRSCVTIAIAVPRRSRISRNSTRISSWMVASSAVVGSSASSSLGAVALAIAISTRCRIPPLSSCGYCRSRSSGAVMCTERNSSTSRSRNCGAGTSQRVASTSPNWLPMVNSGSSEVIGFCRIIEISRPRSSRSSRSDNARIERPSNRTSPETRAALGSARMSAAHSVVLPLPDSPAMPTISPASISRSTPDTACTGRATLPKATERLRTSSSINESSTNGRRRAAPRCPPPSGGAARSADRGIIGRRPRSKRTCSRAQAS